ncbi:MAG: hypothetical protein PSX36_01855, partial [bacterium]|nr:hypothetical protein [bacterium]
MKTLLLCFFITPVFMNAQSIKRESISSTGNSSSSSGVSLSQTVGQPYHTGTKQSDNTAYHPGFQQSIFRTELISSTVEAKIVPNPALQ